MIDTVKEKCACENDLEDIIEDENIELKLVIPVNSIRMRINDLNRQKCPFTRWAENLNGKVLSKISIHKVM